MLQFCKRLVSKGAKATFVNTVFLNKTMHADAESSIEFETISDGYDEGGWKDAESTEVYLENLRITGSKTLFEQLKTN